MENEKKSSELSYDERIRRNVEKTLQSLEENGNDPADLDEAYRDWLRQDAADAEKEPDNPERVETRKQVAAAMMEVRKRIKEAEGKEE